MQGGYTTQFRDLFTEMRRYVRLQKKYWALDAADKLIVLLSTIAIAGVCLILGGIILFFLAITAACWLGQLLGSAALGFLCLSAILALALFIFYKNRTRWVIVPLARIIVGLFENATPDDVTKQEEETADE